MNRIKKMKGNTIDSLKSKFTYGKVKQKDFPKRRKVVLLYLLFVNFLPKWLSHRITLCFAFKIKKINKKKSFKSFTSIHLLATQTKNILLDLTDFSSASPWCEHLLLDCISFLKNIIAEETKLLSLDKAKCT